MLKFFRKLRQKLLAENKFTRYLLYAIGEIILVVIGILLALQINTWNENQQRHKEEKKLLIALIEDFKENKIRIEEAISKEEDVVDRSTALIEAMQSKQAAIDPDQIRNWVASGAKSWWKTEFVTGTYDAMVNSGKIDLLKNEDLKRALSQFSADSDAGFEDHYESMNYLIEMNKISAELTPALIHDSQRETLGISMVNPDYNEAVNKLMDDEAYLGLLISKTWLETLRIDYQRKLQTYVDEILLRCEAALSE
ncbi:MAG: DUF6090 family protein [Bacteroidota bacterium]